MYRIKWIGLAVMMALLMMSGAVFAQSDEATKEKVIGIAADSEMFKDWLGSHANYKSYAYGPDDNGVWYVEFKTEDESEWLGYANVNANTDEIQDSFAPKPLATDVYQAQLPQVTAYALADEEVLARLNHNPKLWKMYPDWNRWDATWDVNFQRGIDTIQVKLRFDEQENVYIDKIVNPNELSEEDQLKKAHNDAINLAYGAEGVGAALDGHDNWTTYVESQGGSRWSVSFVDGDTNLSTVIVDIKAGKVLKVKNQASS